MVKIIFDNQHQQQRTAEAERNVTKFGHKSNIGQQRISTWWCHSYLLQLVNWVFCSALHVNWLSNCFAGLVTFNHSQIDHRGCCASCQSAHRGKILSSVFCSRIFSRCSRPLNSDLLISGQPTLLPEPQPTSWGEHEYLYRISWQSVRQSSPAS